MYIKDLLIEATHGVYDHEKTTPQRFNITLELEVETPNAFTSDDVNDTVDYAKIRESVIDTVQNNSFELIERLAQEIANTVLVDTRITQATIAIDKLDAFETGIPGVRIVRKQN